MPAVLQAVTPPVLEPSVLTLGYFAVQMPNRQWRTGEMELLLFALLELIII